MLDDLREHPFDELAVVTVDPVDALDAVERDPLGQQPGFVAVGPEEGALVGLDVVPEVEVDAQPAKGRPARCLEELDHDPGQRSGVEGHAPED